MSQIAQPRIAVPSQEVLDAALRNARDERAEMLHLISAALARQAKTAWTAVSNATRPVEVEIDAGCTR